MESAEYAVLEAVRLDLRPVFDLVGGDILRVAGHVVGCKGVAPVGADDGHQLVVFVRNGNLGGLVTDGVDLMVNGRPLGRIRLGAVHLKEAVHRREHRLLGRIVGSPEQLASLEHHMLQVVGKAGVVGRIVLAADLDGDVGLDPGLVLVDGHVNLESVVKRADFGVHRIAFDGLIACTTRCKGQKGCRPEKKSFHYTFILFFKRTNVTEKEHISIFFCNFAGYFTKGLCLFLILY